LGSTRIGKAGPFDVFFRGILILFDLCKTQSIDDTGGNEARGLLNDE